MSTARTLADDVLAMVDGGVEAEVYVDTGRSSLTRFANSFIHQNVSEDASEVTLRVAAGGRVSSSTTTASSVDALRTFVDTTIATAAQQPVDKEWPGVGGPVAIPDVEHWDEATANADPLRRAEVVKAFVDAGDGLLGAGYCQTEARSHAYANSAGRAAEGRFTTAVVDGIHQTGTSAGSGHGAGSSLSDLDASALGALAARRARDSVAPFDTKPGEYQVILSPECVATIAVFLDAYGFSAKVAEEGMSFARIGEQQFDDSIDIWDDATNPEALYVPFDFEGTPKDRVDLVRSGVVSSLLHSRRTAAKAKTSSTGSAIPGGDVFGPFGVNMFVGGGDASVESLISSVGRGIYVSTFNYCRVLDPKTLVVTGLTRNGTFMIENGQIADAVTNLRFTQSFVDAIGPGKVGGIGNDQRHADSEFGPMLIHAPSMHLEAWNFTGGADG
ncbi:MAG: TldD/PmbA family protein [Proteobacteria bacterium]|nr:TldD/PmbA family protein [Pseudomonadota bacterium]